MQIIASGRVEVAEDERLTSHPRERLRVGGELAQHSCAAFGRFVEEQLVAEDAVRQRFDGELGVFEIENDLDRALQRRGQRGGDECLEWTGWLDEQRVSAILDVGDD